MSNRIFSILLFCASCLPLSVAADEGFPSELVKRGEQTYLINCSRCHGVHLVNPVGYTFDLRKFPRDQRDRFFSSISKGKGNMPAWGDLLRTDQIEALWSYVSTEGKKQQP